MSGVKAAIACLNATKKGCPHIGRVYVYSGSGFPLSTANNSNKHFMVTAFSSTDDLQTAGAEKLFTGQAGAS